MTQPTDSGEHQMHAAQAPPPRTSPPQDSFQLVQSSQRGGLVATAVILIVVGALGVLIGLFSPAILGGTALVIAGAVFLVGGVLVATAVSVAAWWQFESRQQSGLLARGLSEQFGGEEHMA